MSGMIRAVRVVVDEGANTNQRRGRSDSLGRRCSCSHRSDNFPCKSRIIPNESGV
jgi:hypothetical protein